MKIRTRLLLVFVSLTFVLLPAFVYIVAEEVRPRYLEAQEEALFDFAEVLAAMVSESALVMGADGQVSISTPLLERAFDALPGREFEADIYGFRKTQIDIRIYVTDVNGRVIFDSDNGRDVGADYSRWRDVAYTLDGKYGARASHRDPIYPEGLTLFIARPVMSSGDIIGALVVGKPTRNAKVLMDRLKVNLWLTSAVMAVAGVLIGLVINFWLTRPLAQLQRYAASVGRGERARAPRLGNNEVGDVGRALESMRTALDGKQYIEDYIQTLTHELKAPIAGIKGAAELLGEPLPEDRRQRFLNNILNQTDRLQDLVDRLLELARLENIDALTHEESVDLRAAVGDAVSAAQDFARSRNVDIEIDVPEITVLGDPFLLRQAVLNLLKNAIEHSEDASPVNVVVSRSAAQVFITVTNRGEAIPDYARERIFDRFYSLPNASGQKGTGIGLSFVREIAALHHGRVTFECNTAGETIFRLAVAS